MLQQIEANNTTLATMKKQAEAIKTGSCTGLTLANPEVDLLNVTFYFPVCHPAPYFFVLLLFVCNFLCIF
ncbi:MAG: hypothetical protein LBD59_12380 [Prevotellaceae bacterium]|nr:hypothetical protein [Prevotellaceae bacterium]